MLLVRHLQMQATYGWSLSNLVALLRQQLIYCFMAAAAPPNAWAGFYPAQLQRTHTITAFC